MLKPIPVQIRIQNKAKSAEEEKKYTRKYIPLPSKGVDLDISSQLFLVDTTFMKFWGKFDSLFQANIAARNVEFIKSMREKFTKEDIEILKELSEYVKELNI